MSRSVRLKPGSSRSSSVSTSNRLEVGKGANAQAAAYTQDNATIGDHASGEACLEQLPQSDADPHHEHQEGIETWNHIIPNPTDSLGPPQRENEQIESSLENWETH